MFSFCPPVFFVFTEVLQEFRRDITRDVWTFFKNPAFDRPPTWREDAPLITGVRLTSDSERVRDLAT
ncbi:MAG: hypothetical protein DMF20_05555 [Verrucomicrobia bacterium]|nr:MAG: hypothetical protein DME48_05325 [Verrucomicrobiota bacterium]PYL66755.1 MAG: hypothetical protein DMF20_05555 [Verrucomicrobiota bacterium]